MNDRLPWPPATAARALAFVGLVWLLGFGLFALEPGLGMLVSFLAAWLTLGLIATAMRDPEEAG